MSLAMTAATINDNDNNDYNNFMNDSIINKKRQGHNKTQKRIQTNNNDDSKSIFDMKKVNSVLNSIHNRVADDDDGANYESAQHSEGFKPLNPFNPPDKPLSMGSERTKKEGLSNLVPQPSDEQDLTLQELQSAYMNDSQVREYYNKMMPNYKNQNQNQNQQHSNYYQQSQQQSQPYLGNDTNQVLIDKLNYMINLLEEQQDQRTNNVTEEVVLYSFLGVFMIFIVDSFARVGKYVR